VRFVELPYEDHGYRSRENVGHALAEMIDWAERYTAPVKEGGGGVGAD
jgi:dipeptidyl aminopeptidase/acylaminoacyl peptidase